VKLDRALAALKAGNPAGKIADRETTATPAATAAKPIVSAPVTQKKLAPIKNLNALDKLFGR
jgi:hypothetical protein